MPICPTNNEIAIFQELWWIYLLITPPIEGVQQKYHRIEFNFGQNDNLIFSWNTRVLLQFSLLPFVINSHVTLVIYLYSVVVLSPWQRPAIVFMAAEEDPNNKYHIQYWSIFLIH
jgi:hypothetical protein